MKKLLLVFVLVIIAVSIFFVWWNNGKSPANPQDKSQKTFIISPHQNLREVGYELKKEGLISNPIVFFLMIKQQGLDGKIQAGNFQLSPSMSAMDIAETLTHGTSDIWITVPEGKRAAEIADTLQSKLPTFQPQWRDQLNLQEGYLFPDTYLIPKDATIAMIIQVMRNNFNKKYQQATSASQSKLTQTQIVTLASIIQREGKSSNDMKLVASVLQNRLNTGMALDVDASIQYAMGYQSSQHTWWKNNLTADDLKINSLYNTYSNPGLPPTPICNPGFYALQAAANPANTNYLYYISDNTGMLHFATTLEEHNTNVKKYIQ